MDILLNCYPCIVTMVLTIADLSRFSDDQTKQLMNEALSLLLDVGKTGPVPPPVVAGRLFQKAGEISGDMDRYDPYSALKKKANKTVTDFYHTLVQAVAQSQSPVEKAIKLAALGNILDFAIIDHNTIDILQEVKDIDKLVFEKYDYESFSSRLSTAGHLLILGDNAGEIVFDKLLIQTLNTRFPDLKITYAVRGATIINDVTMEDAREVGLTKAADVISSGSVCPGTYLDDADPDFLDIFEQADLIISKGQGNYETLSKEDRANLFFIFRVKCKHVGARVGAGLHSLILLENR